jgi:hypothetical protein
LQLHFCFQFRTTGQQQSVPYALSLRLFNALSSTNSKLFCYVYFNFELQGNNSQFLDRIEDAAPQGVWCLQHDDSGAKHTLRSLVWPGFEFCVESHNASSGYGAYFGTGEKNRDVLFMV